MKKKFIILMLLIIMLIPTSKVEAKTLQDYYNDLADLEKKYNDAQNNKKLTQSEINKLNADITEINNNIGKTKIEIATAEKDIEESEKNIAEKREETNEFLKFLQLSSGENTYLEYLFDADDYTDFIYRYAIVTQMSEYNNNLIKELETLINDLEEKKKNLNSKKNKLETQLKEFNSKLNTLRANLTKATQEGATVEEEIADLKRDITYYKNIGCSLNQDIDSCVEIALAKGWRYPLAYGCVTSEYTGNNDRTDWSGGGQHHAIDLSCMPEGSPVYAAANGTVASTGRYNCGGNYVFIYHNVNGKSYTTVYMHLLSINVAKGQKVTSDTIIGKMGGYSTSAEHGGYDICTTGAHLHFGIATGHHSTSSSFNSYSINPRNIFEFPYGWGYFYRK